MLLALAPGFTEESPLWSEQVTTEFHSSAAQPSTLCPEHLISTQSTDPGSEDTVLEVFYTLNRNIGMSMYYNCFNKSLEIFPVLHH